VLTNNPMIAMQANFIRLVTCMSSYLRIFACFLIEDLINRMISVGLFGLVGEIG